MDIEDAFKHLELSIDASEEEVRSAFRQLSKRAHPDVQESIPEEQTLLNEARDTALAYIKIRNAVVPISPSNLTQQIRTAVATYNAEPASELARSQFKQRTLSLNLLKWVSWAVGAFAALITLTKGNLVVLNLPSVGAEEEMRRMLGMLAFMFGFAGIVIQFFLKYSEHRMEAFLNRIASKVECARRLARELDFEDVETVTEKHFSGDSESILPVFPMIFFETTPIILQRAVEHDLLRPIEAEAVTPDFRQTYSVNFKPSAFWTPPPPPPKPRTLHEIRNGLLVAIGLLGSLGLITLGLVYFGFKWWGLIPGSIAIIWALGTAVEFSEYIQRMRNDTAQQETEDKA